MFFLLRKFTVFVAILSVFLLFGTAEAQNARPSSQQERPEKFATPATAQDGQTLLTEHYVVRLWGIEAVEVAGVPLRLFARTEMDNLIKGEPVRCQVVEWKSGNQPVAHCVSSTDVDLGLSMIREGYAVVDRPAVLGSVFQDPYFKAEHVAYRANKGAWSAGKGGGGGSLISGQDTFLIAVIFISFLLAPIIGLVFVASVNAKGFRSLGSMQEKQMHMFIERDEKMRDREKYVLAAMLESELNSNKVKVDAFLVVYEEMLKALRDPNKSHKYKQTGEIVHEQPLLNRNVYDSKMDKMDLLEPQLAADLADLYSKINPNPEYITLEPTTPVEEAIYHVEKVIADTRGLVEPMNRVVSSLNIIVRDKKDRGYANVGRPGPNFQRRRS